jgi:hypothetical protein
MLPCAQATGRLIALALRKRLSSRESLDLLKCDAFRSLHIMARECCVFSFMYAAVPRRERSVHRVLVLDVCCEHAKKLVFASLPSACSLF